MNTLLGDPEPRGFGQIWARRGALALAMSAVVVVVAWAGLKLSTPTHGPARQVARIALLPDTPPPPPPPPPDRPPPDAHKEMRQNVEAPKPQAPPEPAQLKMEGQAGEGPSPFAAGDVKSDYIGGEIGNGAQFALYTGRIERLLQEQLARRKLHIANARIFIWLTAEGAVQRFQVTGSDGASDEQLRGLMADVQRVPEAPPRNMPMPVGFEIGQR